MKNFTFTCSTLFFFFITCTVFGQNGQYDVRFSEKEIKCFENKVLVDIEVRATSATNGFHMADQNFRFAYSREAVVAGSVAIEEQQLTGFVAPSTYYGTHNLVGSVDTIASYNVKLTGGKGVLLTTEWLTIGTVSFEILDVTKSMNLTWLGQTHFPSTFIAEKANEVVYAATEGTCQNKIINFTACPTPITLILPGLPNDELPIELTSFTAEENDCAIDLEWVTASEVNNAHFLVQKSADGIDFKTIATIEGAGTSTTTNYYELRDERQAAMNYYRLVQVDYDGKKTTSDIVAAKSECIVKGAEDNITNIFPNPVSNGPINLEFYASSARTATTVVIIDLFGKVVDTYQADFETGKNIFSFSADNLAAGTYLVKVIDGEMMTTAQKFVKAN